MNSKGKSSIQASKPKITTATLMRWAGLSAVLAGLCAIVVGMFHPVNEYVSVTTPTWAIVHVFALGMSFFGLYGMVGLYTRQAEKAGWLGLAGFVMFSLWLVLMFGFGFAEIFVLPHLATAASEFVSSFLAMFSGAPSEMDLGVLPTVWAVTGPLLILGALVFGVATFRAGVLSRWAAALLAVGGAVIPAAAMLPAEHEAKILIPMGLGLAWLGYSLLTERREKSSATVLDQKTTNPEVTEVA